MPCLFSALFFYISSIHYEKFRRTLQSEKEEAQDKASQAQFDDHDSVAGYGYFKKKRDRHGIMGGSYKFVHRPAFGVVRDSSNSQQIVKSRPLVIDEAHRNDD